MRRVTMTKVELSLIMELYKQINELQHENMLLDNKVCKLKDDVNELRHENILLDNRFWELKDDICELETENKVLKTELLNSLRRSLDS
jgi:uncharacterized coiled-coil DUF342 family protein